MSQTYNNYSISTSKGKLYLKSKTPQDGFEKVTYGTNGESTTYHQYKDSVKGFPTHLEVKEIIYNDKTLKFLELTLTDGETLNKVSTPLKNIKNGYTDETRALISALNGLTLGEEVMLTTKSTTTTGKNGKEYKNLNIYINYVNILGENGKGKGTGFIPYAEIPAPIEKVVAGDKVYDWSPQTEFFYSKLGEIQARFQNAPTTTSPQVEAKSTNALPPQTTAQAFAPAGKLNTENEMDNLPF